MTEVPGIFDGHVLAMKPDGISPPGVTWQSHMSHWGLDVSRFATAVKKGGSMLGTRETTVTFTYSMCIYHICEYMLIRLYGHWSITCLELSSFS